MGILDTAYNLYANARDFDYQKNLQQQIFEREDTAVQRRVADLKAAGLNPNLATGQAAGAGAVVSRSNTNDVQFGSAIDTMAAVQQIKGQKYQNEKVKAEAQLSETEAAEKTYTTLMRMGIDAIPYYDKGKIYIGVPNGLQKTEAYQNDLNFYQLQDKDKKRQFERNEEQFQSNMNLVLSKTNLTTSQINQITNSINMSHQEFAQRVFEFNSEMGNKLNEQNFTHTMETYIELRKQMETAVTLQEKQAAIQHILKQNKHMDVEEEQAWTKLILDSLGNVTKCLNVLSLL